VESQTIPAPFFFAKRAKTTIQRHGQRVAWLYRFPTDLELRALLADQPRQGIQLEFLEYLYRHKASHRKREFNELLNHTCEWDPLRPGYIRVKLMFSYNHSGSIARNLLHRDSIPLDDRLRSAIPDEGIMFQDIRKKFPGQARRRGELVIALLRVARWHPAIPGLIIRKDIADADGPNGT
jgi:hypothetical protein